MLAYRVPSSVSWGTLFTVMEALKTGQHPGSSPDPDPDPSSPPIVEVYAASDTSLEQVFLSFAREAAQQQPKDLAPPQAAPVMVTEL